MASTTVSTLALILISMIAKIVLSNPVPQSTYNVYSRLVCETERLWQDEYELTTNFKADRMPGAPDEIPEVPVENLRLTNEMTEAMRRESTEIDLLDEHRDFLYNYKYIIDYVLADELNTTSGNSFKTGLEDVRRFISFTITELEDTMIHLDHVSRASVNMPDADRPYFNPAWEKNTFNRYLRDLYVLEEMKTHFGKAFQDFSKLRINYIQHDTVAYDCEF